MRPTRVEINLNQIKNNIGTIKRRIGSDASLMAIVKANAYGHGIVEVANEALSSGVRWLGVAIPEEGVRLRCAGIDCDILVLGGIDPTQVDLVLDYDLSLCIFSTDMAELINERAKSAHKLAKVHLKIDSGMGRIGVRQESEIIQLYTALQGMSNLSLRGIFTHLSSADNYDRSYTLGQLMHFKDILSKVIKIHVPNIWIHAANTASIFNYPESHFNMVRPGIGIYGYLPGCDRKDNPGLEPALSWYTKIVYLKQLGAGCSISYGRTYTTNKTRTIATVPVGYGDGYSRLLGNKGWVLIKGEKAPIVGNICMDQMMVDVTDIPNTVLGDDVVLIGKQGHKSIYADELAGLYGTISYEVLTNISSRVPRIYVKD